MITKLKGNDLTRYIDEQIEACEKWLKANEKKTNSKKAGA